MLKNKLNNSFALYIVLIAMGVLVAKSSDVLAAVRQSLEICFSSVIPALFPFMVLSSAFVANVSDSSFKHVSRITSPLFGISPCGTAAFICGMVCGYPIGARCTAELYNSKKITASEAESLIAYSNNSGPLFIIGTVGSAMLGSPKGGILLYAVQLISALTAALLLKRHTIRRVITVHGSPKSRKDFTASICDSVTSMLSVCGFIVFFSVVNTLLKPITDKLPSTAGSVVSSVIEVTNAANIISSGEGTLRYKLTLASLALGWSGMSVHMQVKSILRDTGLSMKKYYITRVFMSLYSALLTNLILNYKDNIALALCNLRILIFAAAACMCIFALVLVLKKERKPSIPENLPSCNTNLKYKH